MSNMNDSHKLSIYLDQKGFKYYKSGGLILFNVYGPNGGVPIHRVFYLLGNDQFYAIKLVKAPLDLDEVEKELSKCST